MSDVKDNDGAQLRSPEKTTWASVRVVFTGELPMNYKELVNEVKQSPELYLRQMQAMQNMAPQANVKNSLHYAVIKAQK
jgi:hypothetical protein